MMRRILCVFRWLRRHRWHMWVYQYHGQPEMGNKRWCSECGQVELAYEVWKGTYYSFDQWVREEDWYKLSYIKDPSKSLSKLQGWDR